ISIHQFILTVEALCFRAWKEGRPETIIHSSTGVIVEFREWGGNTLLAHYPEPELGSLSRFLIISSQDVSRRLPIERFGCIFYVDTIRGGRVWQPRSLQSGEIVWLWASRKQWRRTLSCARANPLL